MSEASMEGTGLVEFAVNVIGARVGDGKDYKAMGLLADVLEAAAGAVGHEEWMCMWTDAAAPLYFKRTTETFVREKLQVAASKFVQDKETAHLLTSSFPKGDKLALGLTVHLVSHSPTHFKPGFAEDLLSTVLQVDDEDWIGLQLSKIFKVITPAADQKHRMWSALEEKGGGSPGAAVSALRLTEIFGTTGLSDTFIRSSLQHRTRATRRMGLQLMKPSYEAVQWWGPWSAAFTVISDEQPWHIIHPAWQDAIAVLSETPKLWCAVLAARGASHSDNRVVRRVCTDIFAAELSLDIAKEITVPALAAGCEMPTTQPELTRHLLSVIYKEPTLGRETAETFLAMQTADYEAADHPAIAEELHGVCKSWRGSGHSAACLTPVATACLRFASDDERSVQHAMGCLQCVPLSQVPCVVDGSGLSEGARTGLVEKVIRVMGGEADFGLVALVSAEAVKRAAADGEASRKFALSAAVCGDDVVAGKDEVVVLGVTYTFEWIKEKITARDGEVIAAVGTLAEHFPVFLASTAAALFASDPDTAAHLTQAVPPSTWSTHPSKPLVEAWITDTPTTPKEMPSKLVVFSLIGGADPVWLEGVVSHYKSLKVMKKAKTPTKGVRELMEAVRTSGKHVADAWRILLKFPPKFSGSREAYRAFFTAAVCAGSLQELEGLEDRAVQSSIVASQLTAAVLKEIDDARLLARLAVHAPAPKAQALDNNHPAVVICKTTDRKTDASEFAAAVLEEVRRDTEPEGNDGSAAQLRRVREWWVLVSLLPQITPALVDQIAQAAVAELKAARVVPRTRVLVQNAWAAACALAPTQPSCLTLLISTLANHSTETRLAVSSLVVASHLLLTDSGVDKKQLTHHVLGWTMAMPHTAKIHAQLVLAEVVERDDFDSEFLKGVKGFLAENPHLRALRGHAGIERSVSLYLKETPPFVQVSAEMRVLKALRLVQNKFSELEGNENEVQAHSAGWASKGSRKCPARARGGGKVEEDEDASSGEEEIVDATHQRRPTPGRPTLSKESQICVVGSFLDNLPNQAGLCRTLEALFGNIAECTLPSLKATQEPAFLRMSMASERWLKLVEIPPGERLATYIQRKRREGFTIVALEQTDTSISAPNYTFDKKTVIIIGNEQLGCPSWLLRRPELVHDFVELPLDGASRSLNAHVTAAAMLWQYKMQTSQ